MRLIGVRIRAWKNGRVADPIVDDLVKSGDGWCRNDSAEPVDLASVVAVEPDGALSIEIDPGEASVWEVVAVLPASEPYVGYQDREVETGHPYLDIDDDGAGLRVEINGQRWALVPSRTSWSGEDAWNWVPCEIDPKWGGVTAPVTRRVICQVATIEEGSRTSGWFIWTIHEIDDEAVCLEIELDEDGRSCEVMMRNGRTDRDFVEVLVDILREQDDWSSLPLAIVAAMADGGTFDGYADSLDPKESESCRISVVLPLEGDGGS